MTLSSNNDSISDAQKRFETFRRLQSDLTYFSKHCLRIRDKAGALLPLNFNKAQTYLHARLEEQRRRTGKVRAVLVKGRQQGCSTYVAARFYHRASLNSGISAFILAHIAESTDHLFKMVGRYYDNAPEPIKPGVKIANRRNLEFEGIHSQYSVGTAGSENVGRSMTFQLFHGSECAFWPNTDEIMTGVLQGVADVPGSEIIFESTANGMGNLFHKMAINGLDPESEFMTVFIPWFWQDEYVKPVPTNFEPTEEEVHIAQTYNLTEQQIYWRRRKIQDVFGGELWKFQREYPCSLQEAFITSGETLISGEYVDKARKAKVKDPIAPLVMGVDPARSGDRTVIVLRRGRQVVNKFTYTNMDEMLLAGIIAKMLDVDPIQKCFVDVGLGYGTVDRLKELGYGGIVTGVHFGSSAMEPDIYQNKRVEMYDHMRKWFADGGVSIPDDDEFCCDILAIPPFTQTTGRGVLSMVPKEKIIEIYGKSPDHADALALTFAFPVSTRNTNRISRKEPEMLRKNSPLSTIRRAAGKKDNSAGFRSSIRLI